MKTFFKNDGRPPISLVVLFLFFLFLQALSAGENPAVFRILLTGCEGGKGFVQTGFRAQWNGQEGVITALHGVAGCRRCSAAQGGEKDGIYLDDLALVAVDIDRDIAFLASRKLQDIPGQPLKGTGYDLSRDQLQVVGYPDGVLIQRASPVSYHIDPLVGLGVWHQEVRKMCEQRRSPNCGIKVLLVRGDPLIPGHSGAPLLNQNGQIVGVADGGLKGGLALLNWIIPYKDIQLSSVSYAGNANALHSLRQMNLYDLFAAPSSMDPSRFYGGEGATISGQIFYGGYGSPPIGLLSNYSKAKAIIRLMEVETRKEVPVDFDYDPNTGNYTIYNVPSGKYTPFVKVESGYPFHKTSGGDFISYLSGLNEDIVVAPHDKNIYRGLHVVHSIHLKKPVDNQKERTFTQDPPEVLYKGPIYPSASVFEWDPVPGATAYQVRILLMDGASNTRIDEKDFNISGTSISPGLAANYGNTYYMFLVSAYYGSGWDKLIGHFSNYYKDGFGGWFIFKVVEYSAVSEVFLEAERLNGFSPHVAVDNCSEGGQYLGWINNGDWVRYDNIDFGSNGMSSFSARVSSGEKGGVIRIRLNAPDGEVAGSCTVPSTGGWQNWTTINCALYKRISGTNNLFLTFEGEGLYLLNINWMRFSN
ncbi:MAG: carbohydrate-binding protein [Phaeodactylibacter sp.]|nr:carbohydrate-binding protein [Phaeodactylibacter sp.]MCB9288668.1 carbohydrate-binding protein [Lewinellaceae bacterium]